MGCKGSKQTEVENTYGELNKNIQKTMLRAGLNLGVRWDYLKHTKETLQPLVIRKRFYNLYNL